MEKSCDLRSLRKSHDVAVCVFDGCNELAPANIFDFLLNLCTSVKQQLQNFFDVVYLVVSSHPMLVAIGIKAYILVAELETHIIGAIRIWLHTQKLGKKRFCFGKIFDRID